MSEFNLAEKLALEWVYAQIENVLENCDSNEKIVNKLETIMTRMEKRIENIYKEN